MKLALAVLATGCVHARETVSSRVAITDVGVGWSRGREGGQIRPRVAAGVRFLTPLRPAEPGLKPHGAEGGVAARTIGEPAEPEGLHGTLFGIKIGADILMHPESSSTSMFVVEGSLASALGFDPDHDPTIDEVSVAADVFAGVGWSSRCITIAGGPVGGLLETQLGTIPYLGLALRATTF